MFLASLSSGIPTTEVYDMERDSTLERMTLMIPIATHEILGVVG
jgi:hypothetical protein